MNNINNINNNPNQNYNLNHQQHNQNPNLFANPRLYNQHFQCRLVDENTGAVFQQPVDLNMRIDNFMNIFRHQALYVFQRNPPHAVFLPQLRPSPNVIVNMELINESNNQVMLRNFEGHGQAILGEYLRACFNNPNDMEHLVFLVTDHPQHHNNIPIIQNNQPVDNADNLENDDMNWQT